MSSSSARMTTMTTTILVVVSLIFSATAAAADDKAPANDDNVQYYLRCLTSKLDLGDLNDQPCYMFLKYLPFVKVLPAEFVKALSVLYDNNQTRVDLQLCHIYPDRCPDHTVKLLRAYKHDERVWKFSTKCSIR